ncbi:unnamed protein product [Heligmosomoides polygyrus]|uniref:Reverse transcriptase domain-containing protein n=1 Tax=Heligmosomoides polygyrus TaxID=6339 RepID=A0A183FLE6_HELPZ|nr:unnamed protein product [Heligmosomoides polygyrus]
MIGVRWVRQARRVRRGGGRRLGYEIRHAISSVKKRTAFAPDRIRPEHPKFLPSTLIDFLARLFTRYLSECKAPSQWKTNRTVLLYKKGNVHDIGNYRQICLLSVVYKLFTRVILNPVDISTPEAQLDESYRRKLGGLLPQLISL